MSYDFQGYRSSTGLPSAEEAQQVTGSEEGLLGVDYSIPYWYTGEKANDAFALKSYLKAVKKFAGLFAYDPQTDRAFDPEGEGAMSDSEKYSRISADLPKMIARAKKPWWKFW